MNEQDNKDTMYWARHKPNALINVSPTPDKDFFKWWCVLLTSFIKLTPKEINVVASFLRQRHQLSKVVSSSDVLESQLMSNATRDKIIQECDITLMDFYVTKSKLKKKGVITDNGIHPKLIPHFREGDNNHFQLLIAFSNLDIS